MKDAIPLFVNAPMKILMAEDDRELRSFLKRAFGTLPVKLSAVEDGVGLADSLERESWDLVVTDRHMPGPDVLETLAEHRVNHPYEPLILMSGGLSTQDRAVAERLGLVVLEKPFSFGDLVALAGLQLRRD